MKAFAFRLEHALRWREGQVELQKARVAAASASLADIRNSIEARTSELAGARIGNDSTGAALEAYAVFSQRTRARIRDLEDQAAAAERRLAQEMKGLVEANQKLKVVENLRENELRNWRRDFERELSAFADESFLNRYN